MITIDTEGLQGQKKKILVVDDDPYILNLLGIYIASFGHEFIAAKDGMEAMECMKRGSFDIIITDMVMPRMDGMDLLKYTRQYYPQTDVIVVTGHAGSFSYMDVIRAGAIDYISKPFTEDELEAKLNRVLRERWIISELERLSKCDALTGLFNRRHFDIKLWEETHRAYRQGYSVFLALLDVDNFKQYNDTFGHQAGDSVLQSIGEIMAQGARENVDSTFRYGGDEFAIIIPQTKKEQALRVAERILHRYDEHGFDIIGLSVGLAMFVRREGKSWDDDVSYLVGRADKSLYAAKRKGGNHVAFSNEEEKSKSD